MMRATSTARRCGQVAVVVLLLLLTACGNLGDLSFRQDHRLRFTAPDDRELVERPVTVSWEMTGFRVAPRGSEPASREAGYFALFVDRAPMKPGESLTDLAAADAECVRLSGCPDEQYFADRGIYVTTETSYALPAVPDLDTKDDPQLHTVTVVLLDTDGDRIGESAWYVEFKLPRRSA